MLSGYISSFGIDGAIDMYFKGPHHLNFQEIMKIQISFYVSLTHCCLVMPKGAFTLHPRSRSDDPSPSSDAIKTIELIFRVYTDPSPSPRFLSRTSVSELVATYSNFLGGGRPSTSEVMKRACSKLPVHVFATKFGPKWPWTRMTSDPSLGCSVNTVLSGSRTQMLGQC